MSDIEFCRNTRRKFPAVVPLERHSSQMELERISGRFCEDAASSSKSPISPQVSRPRDVKSRGKTLLTLTWLLSREHVTSSPSTSSSFPHFSDVSNVPRTETSLRFTNPGSHNFVTPIKQCVTFLAPNVGQECFKWRPTLGRAFMFWPVISALLHACYGVNYICIRIIMCLRPTSFLSPPQDADIGEDGQLPPLGFS